MWSPTLLFDRCVYGPEKMSSLTQKDFCNTIGAKQTFRETPRARRFPHPGCWLRVAQRGVQSLCTYGAQRSPLGAQGLFLVGSFSLTLLVHRFLQQAMTDRPSETGSHARALLPDRRRRCRRRVSPEFVRCRRGCTAIKFINGQHTTVNVPIDHGLKVRHRGAEPITSVHNLRQMAFDLGDRRRL
jgi:hypothetical protein